MKEQKVDFEKKFIKTFHFFDEDRNTRKLRKFFVERFDTPFRSGADRCERLIIDMAYKTRYIHPIMVCELFSCDLENAWKLIDRLLRKELLKIQPIKGFGVGFHINKHGNYLLKASIPAKKKHIFENSPYYSKDGIRVSSKVSNKLFHDLTAVRILLRMAKEIDLIDFIPEYASGVDPKEADKIPDIFALTKSGSEIWIENELSPKSGSDLKRFTALHFKALRDNATSRIYVFLNSQSDVKNYLRSFILNCQINNCDEETISFIDTSDIEAMKKYCSSKNYYVEESSEVQNYGPLMGNLPSNIKLFKKYFLGKHSPTKWNENREKTPEEYESIIHNLQKQIKIKDDEILDMYLKSIGV